jgi:DNA/RNA endonuclease YhcR with UshA esterase domain
MPHYCDAMADPIRSFVFSLISGLVYLPLRNNRPRPLSRPTKQQHTVNEWATVEGVVAKVFTSKSGNTFLNIGASYPNQTFTGWIPPASAVSKSPMLSEIEGKRLKITGRIELYKGKPEIRINAAEQLEVE